jgi:GrpB-like predicted nucleotidyltransferase (UPF0157 family)
MLKIVPYNENWPVEFQQIAADLRRGLGALALHIDHIGSTSVPGLDAKDVLDVQISVAALDERVRAAMLALGYVQAEGIWRDHRPPNTPEAVDEWKKLMFIQAPGQRRINVHVRMLGRANQRYPLLFRDYLRMHPATAEAYGELKRRLVQNLADWETYPDVKDPAVDLIYFAAEDWAATTSWQPRPSDA